VDDGWGRQVTRYSPETFSTESTFGKMFGLIAPKLLRALSDGLVSEALGRSIYEESNGERQLTKSFSLSDQDLETLKIQLMA
ncbi:hypothetical protein R0K30_22995, partial [Bacillus sp. SIMBA_154]|uniref:hypothetical protein n=1 Tax=Bacillus sp. SIMBA_154 TaxID=3080859 RepID=UPI00397D74FD